jgi:hypothetical protein
MTQWLHEFQFRLGFKVKRMRCDNAGENRQFQKYLNRLPHHIKFENTAPNTPQQNGKLERKFATLYGKVRAMPNCTLF